MLICKICGVSKEKESFYNTGKGTGKKMSSCIQCVKEKSIKWALNNKEHRKEYLKNWGANNISKVREDKAKYRDDNREKTRLYHREYQKQRRVSNPLQKMKHNLRNRINLAVRCKYWKARGGSEKLLGGTYEFVMDYLTSKLKEGMTWENYGEWHIDHIIPLASAKTKEELISLCHYTNLQPLSAFENKSKGSKIYKSIAL
jgi:hypothetical protein